MDHEPWWVAESVWRLPADQRQTAIDRISVAVEQHIVLCSSGDELARRRAGRWLRANGLGALAELDD
ncbi:hypothetical protein [Actinokineospora sp. NBRC 105648]|uniref:hypothetical protein n=1 Tax=Actinokineospora sp. NBRC 105648 TaxID=3032206 RepID=UPI0025528E3B|nr:hypothetical protein [Actinokineospora sp. NBRC 105648]